MITEEIWSYSTHRLMHTPFFYSRIHKKHHEYRGSISYSAEYAHPVEFIGVNVIAAGTGAMILGPRMHIVTFLTWICYRIGDTIDQHCGYDFPWNPYSIMPFASNLYIASAQYHDFHHTNNNGNYSSGFVCLDYWLGTERMKNKKKNA
jgi:sterol desaturase/sphingolipid hydroxylase (fatty acid hydroxylase superfamily)